MDVDASKKIEDLKKDLAAGRIDQACYDIELEDIEGLESDVFDEEEQEVEEEPLVEEKPPKDDTGEQQASAREALMRRYPNSPELW